MGKPLEVGIVGCGTIGTEVCRAAHEGRIRAVVVALCDTEVSRAEDLEQRFAPEAVVGSIEDVVSRSQLVVEAARLAVVQEVAECCLRLKRNVLVMSVGGLLQDPTLFERAADRGCRIYVPSGAVAGLDGLQAAAQARLESVILTTRKPPRSLEGASYLKENNIDLSNISSETVIFEGTAAEAVEAFPQNINVAAAVSLAGIGAEQTWVRILTDPAWKHNSHEVAVKGEFGQLTVRCENLPSPHNAKTSYLAALSAVATLKKLTSALAVGA